MNPRWLKWLLFAAFIGLVLTVCVSAEVQEAKKYNQSQPAKTDQQNSQPSNSTANPSSPQHRQERDQKSHWYDAFLNHLTEWLLVLFNCILAIFTARLFYATDKQAKEMQASINAAVTSSQAAITGNQIAVTNAQQQLRAYVTVQEIQMNPHRHPSTFPGTEFWRREVQGAIHTYEFTPVLRNGGQTPAINVTASVTLRRFPDGVPDDFTFPDEGEHGGGVIGPQTEWFAPPQSASAGIVTPNDAAKLLLWGAIEYDDIFTGTFRHRTEFCFQIVARAITDETRLAFVPFKRYNNVDGNCEADFDPHENRYH